MSEQKEARILDHDYDGIQEFDNPLPGWWLATFYGAIVFAFLYVGYYQFGPGKGSVESLTEEMAELRARELAAAPGEQPPTEEALAAIAHDPARMSAGRTVFAEKCASCHAPDGGGLIGPNLTDRFWIHGKGSLTDILAVVNEGVLDKGMPPWKSMLKKDEVQSVVAYAHTLKGTHPAKPKEPQGAEVKD